MMYEFQGELGLCGQNEAEEWRCEVVLAWGGACLCLKKARKEIVRACLELRVPVGLCKNEKQRHAH